MESQEREHEIGRKERFFAVYKELETIRTGAEGGEDREAAIRVIREAEKRFAERGGGESRS